VSDERRPERAELTEEVTNTGLAVSDERRPERSGAIELDERRMRMVVLSAVEPAGKWASMEARVIGQGKTLTWFSPSPYFPPSWLFATWRTDDKP
jgi:hypothetical protein